ncbi:CHAT domain-containing protein [Bradyrhizobium liaoningense]|uniref:CHAT domain-containing tetratricopeptide repeat protein n=1 Tax=Bradyrhizobium liaoningense TaxID=43992 RepID=UPI001BA7BE63|nr:CHAT domain-containing protein [Bradyrhizobium liaoningense]MBR0840865.1 CHAT domain-containing protein [Bradyrhizobium liaoningense]
MPDPFNPQHITAVMPLFALVQGWQAVTQPPTAGFSRTDVVLDATEFVVGKEGLASLRSAVAAQDPRALAAVEMLAANLEPILEMSRSICINLREAGRYQDLLAEADRLLLFAEATSRADRKIDAILLRATALRRLQDTQGAIAAYRLALATVSPDNTKVRSAALDNLANILTETGEYDEALKCYLDSEKHATDPRDRSTILVNRARLRHSLGDLSAARADLEASKAFLTQAVANPTAWGQIYDFDAQLTAQEGMLDKGLALALEAQTLLKEAGPQDRAVNAIIRADLQSRLDLRAASVAAFDEALALAEEAVASTINEASYRSGLAAALKRQLPPTDEVYRLFETALLMDSRGEPQQSQEYLAAALNRARKSGDALIALRVEMNWVALLQKLGQVPKAGAMGRDLRQQAMRYRLAYAEAGAIVSLSSLSDDGADNTIDSLFGYARARVLFAMHERHVAELGLDPARAAYETIDNGTLDNQLGKLAQRAGALERAVSFTRIAADKAMQSVPFEWITSNRLAGLLYLNRKLGRADDAAAAAARIRSLLSDARLRSRARLIACRAIGSDLLKDAPEQAEEFLRMAVDLAEDIRRNIKELSERAVVDRQYRDVYPKYAMLLRKAGKVTAAYEALQLGRGRALLDADPSRDGKPATLAEIQAAIPAGEYLVEFAIEQNGLAAYIVTSSGLDAIPVEGDGDALQTADFGDMRQRAARLLDTCRRSPLILDLIAQVSRRIPVGSRVLMVPDVGLHNLPLHITPVEGRPWCELASIGYLPAAAFLLVSTKMQASSVFVAGNSRGDLPAADVECDEVAALYGTSPFKKAECTRSRLEEVLEDGPLDIVHLAVHGRGNPRRGSQSSLMFATESGSTELVDIEALAERRWPARLVVLSGCSTGLGGLRDGRELVSVAGRILQSGAKAVVASLWSVGDENARVFMRAFHATLKDAPDQEKDYRTALDAGRAALAAGQASGGGKVRDGRDILPQDVAPQPVADALSDLDWASFVVVGDPRAACTV